ncbi:hypothetical protein NEHOM01_2047 [Nematocida homosporus]|uniref:uncharacterized protein n=1 Tax=Nematocida homosporus TaxID=1912981 RepID=UPI00221EB898|nr:uncharacterized protein NEHOM01_2047 [Nematocida homosporus]KAI5187256.1 hypothetical protein NEHOM01_2047 [Nematocida homosporus]
MSTATNPIITSNNQAKVIVGSSRSARMKGIKGLLVGSCFTAVLCISSCISVFFMLYASIRDKIPANADKSYQQLHTLLGGGLLIFMIAALHYLYSTCCLSQKRGALLMAIVWALIGFGLTIIQTHCLLRVAIKLEGNSSNEFLFFIACRVVLTSMGLLFAIFSAFSLLEAARRSGWRLINNSCSTSILIAGVIFMLCVLGHWDGVEAAILSYPVNRFLSQLTPSALRDVLAQAANYTRQHIGAGKD